MDEIIFLIILVVLAVIALPLISILVMVNTRKKIARMQAQIDGLGVSLETLRAAAANSPGIETLKTPLPTSPVEQKVDVAARETIKYPAETEPPAVYASAEMADNQAPAITDRVPQSPQPAPVAAARGKNPVDRFEDALRRVARAASGYFTDGNLFVRIGILVLFFGVAFLLKYAAENSRIPIEFRFMGAAAGGLGLLLTGWYLRRSKALYGLLLQGGGIGVIYITIFAAFRIAQLLPPGLTFGLLVLFSATAVALAILQNSKALAICAVLGGFLAPLLASSDSGNYIGLFSYYAVLNAAVFAIAWYRAWRSLNLVGFIFTFGVFAAWVAFSYQPQDWLPASAFLLLFLLMYSLIGVLYALRQPEQLTGLVDGSLVFGTPVIVSSLLMVMLRQFDYGIAAASAGMGIYYILLARFAWRHIGAEFRLLAEAMLAIGVVFATLAIPYALDGHWSSAAWALEAAGILWVAIRQQRFYAQCFAIALQFGAGLLFLLRNIDDVGSSAWLNPAFLGGVFIALGGFISARMLYLQATGFTLRKLHLPFYLWALGWWLVSALVQIDEYLRHEEVCAWLVLFTTTATILVYLDRLRNWQWMPAAVSAALLLPTLMFIALYSLVDNNHVLVKPDLYFWIAALAAGYWIISKLESLAWPGWVIIASHCGWVLLVTLILSLELLWIIDQRLDIHAAGYAALFALLPLLVIRVAQLAEMPAIKRLGADLQIAIIATLSTLLLIWGLIINLTNSGDPAPLPYIPFLNPIDISQIAFMLLALASLKLVTAGRLVQRNHLWIILAGFCFTWLTAVLTRSMHHYVDIPFDLSTMLGDTRVQTAISILWTIIGMAAMLFASRRLIRPAWIAGATLVGAVLVKMFFIDLGASGTVERIVSFLVVGSLLVATGYFSPIPPRQSEPARDPGDTAHA
ncbi:MAG TPA: DUF2339 domain-containing protein [Gammaproteobacteria bacterium]|nr:DUF2339 domain-containing protein [Gammaproteobacteria bacterium]